MGGNFAHRWTQTREAIEAMKALWANEAAEYHGRYYDFPLVRSFPRPVQLPHPPIFLGGSAQQVFKRIVEYGNSWMPTRSIPEIIKQGRAVLNELAVEAGRDLWAVCRICGWGSSRSGVKAGMASTASKSSNSSQAFSQTGTSGYCKPCKSNGTDEFHPKKKAGRGTSFGTSEFANSIARFVTRIFPL